MTVGAGGHCFRLLTGLTPLVKGVLHLRMGMATLLLLALMGMPL